MVALLAKRKWDGNAGDGFGAVKRGTGRNTKEARLNEDATKKEHKDKQMTCDSAEMLPGQWDDSGATDDMRRQRAIFYRQAYRMTPEHFWRLHHILSKHMNPKGNQAFRLSAALRHFAGGDSESDHGIKDPEAMDEYISEVVEAIHCCEEMDIMFPSNHQKQREIAACFELLKSDVGLTSCVGALGSMLVWIAKPAGIDENPQEFFNESKKRFGLHLQAVCDHEGRFLDVSISQGSVSDCVAFEDSSLCHKASQPDFLDEGLALYGGEGYLPSELVVTPMTEIDDPEVIEDFNFYQKQLSSLAGATFTSFLQRWGLLRRALPAKMGTVKQVSLVEALCKLHNFCLDDSEPMLSSLTKDLVHGLGHGSLFVGDMINCELLNCGNNAEDLKAKKLMQVKQGAPKRKLEETIIKVLKEKEGSKSITTCRRSSMTLFHEESITL